MSKKRFNPDLQDEILADEDVLTNEHDQADVEASDADNVAEEDWQEKYNQSNDSYLRLNAEFDNYRKRTLKEKADFQKMGAERVLVDIVDIIDDFERALDNISKIDNDDAKAVSKGVELIYNKFKNFLSKYNVSEIEAIGQPFDVDKHEAVTMVPADKEEDKNKIIDCIQKGYMLDGKVIRFPKVIVAK